MHASVHAVQAPEPPSTTSLPAPSAPVYTPAPSLPSPEISASPPKSGTSDLSVHLVAPAQHPTPHAPATPVDFSTGLAEHIARSIATSMAQWALAQAGNTAVGGAGAAGNLIGSLQPNSAGLTSQQDPSTIQAITAAAATAAAAAATSMILAASEALQQRIADMIPSGMPIVLPQLVDLMPSAANLTSFPKKLPPHLQQQQQQHNLQQQQPPVSLQQPFGGGGSVNNMDLAGLDRSSQPQVYLPADLVMMQQQMAEFAYAQQLQMQQQAQLQWQLSPFSTLGAGALGEQPLVWPQPQLFPIRDQQDSGSGQGEYHTANGSGSGSGQEQPSNGLNDGTAAGSHTRAGLHLPVSQGPYNSVMLAQHPTQPSSHNHGRSVASVYTRPPSGSPAAVEQLALGPGMLPGGIRAAQDLPAVSRMQSAAHHWSSANLQSFATPLSELTPASHHAPAKGAGACTRTGSTETAMKINACNNVGAALLNGALPPSVFVHTQQACVPGSCGESRLGVRAEMVAANPKQPLLVPQPLGRNGLSNASVLAAAAGWQQVPPLVDVSVLTGGVPALLQPSGQVLKKHLIDIRDIAPGSVAGEPMGFLQTGVTAEENRLFSSSMEAHGDVLSSGTGSGSAVDFTGETICSAWDHAPETQDIMLLRDGVQAWDITLVDGGIGGCLFARAAVLNALYYLRSILKPSYIIIQPSRLCLCSLSCDHRPAYCHRGMEFVTAMRCITIHTVMPQPDSSELRVQSLSIPFLYITQVAWQSENLTLFATNLAAVMLTSLTRGCECEDALQCIVFPHN